MRATPRIWAALLAGALLLPGCAVLGGAPSSGEAEDPIVRPDAPAEYDVLVAQQLAIEGRTAEAVEAYLRAVAKDPDSAYLQRRAAVGLAQANRLGEALLHTRRAVELDPGDEASRLFLAQLYRLQRQPEAAADALRDAEGEPFGPEAAFLLYQVQLESGRVAEALETARWLEAAEPDDLRGVVAVANAYEQLERPVEAESALRRALRTDPKNLRLYGALARLLRARGDHEAEAQLYRDVLDRYPNHHATLVALGEAQLAVDDVEGAIRTFERVEERYPDDLQSSVRLGYLLFEKRGYVEAAARFERALAAEPEEREIAFFLGVVRRRLGDVEGALELFRAIPEDHRFYPEARAQIASVYERRGEFDLALEEVVRANELRPTRELQLYVATLRAKMGDLARAVDLVEKMLEGEPEDDDLLFNLGVVYGEAERTDEAIGYMRRALEKNPDNASALNYIGYTFAEKGENLDEAERMIRRAIELRPDDGYIVDSLGWVYYMRARPLVEEGRAAQAEPFIERALEELERAHELTGGDPVISEHLGDTYLLLDQKERALEMFEEALQLEPREGEQPQLLEKFETLQRELR